MTETFLIAGARRTGTTLLNAVVCSDPAANPLIGEAQVLTRIAETYVWAKRHFDLFGKDYFTDAADLRHFFDRQASAFIAHTSERFQPASHLFLKNPELSLVLGEVAELLPDARFLVSLRDPRDQVVSELETGLRQIERGLENEVAAQRNVAALAQGYRHYYEPILAARQREPERFLLVAYEDLVLETEATLERLRAFTGLPLTDFDPRNDWQRVALSWDTYRELPSFTPFYGKKIAPNRVGRHVHVLTTEEARVVESVCSDLMKLFGYPR